MTTAYRFKGDGVDFQTVGQLQQKDGVYVVVAAASADQIALIQLHASRKKPLQILCDVGDETVAAMPVRKVRAKDVGNGRVEIWAIVG